MRDMNPEKDFHKRSILDAIEVITAGRDQPHDNSWGHERLATLVKERGAGDDFQGTLRLLYGFMNLTMLLVDDHEIRDGERAQEWLQRIAGTVSIW